MIEASRKIIVACILTAASFLAFAQVAPAAGSVGNADARIFAVDLGMVAGYSLNAKAPTVGRSFGLNFIVSDNVAVGFYNTIATATTYNLLKFGYYFSPALAFNLYVGSDAAGANTAAGLGASFALLKTRSDTALSSALKLRLEYLFDTVAGPASGDLVFAVSSSLGL
jgi:hypothetical protein